MSYREDFTRLDSFMTTCDHFDFRDALWTDVVAALFAFREKSNLQGAYAYVQSQPGLQTRMVEKLVLDLDLEDCIDLGSTSRERGAASTGSMHREAWRHQGRVGTGASAVGRFQRWWSGDPGLAGRAQAAFRPWYSAVHTPY